ncbi:hypothetical protein ES705_20562 [subsurface metagenome]
MPKYRCPDCGYEGEPVVKIGRTEYLHVCPNCSELFDENDRIRKEKNVATKEESERFAREVGLAIDHLGNIPDQEEDREARLQNCVTMLEIIQQEFKQEAEE